MAEKRYLPGGIREMLVIALPMVISTSCDSFMTFVDRLFLARLGPAHMSAAMGGGLTAFTMMTFVFGLTAYTTPLVAQFLGSGRKKYCGVVLTQALIIALIGCPIVFACRPLAHWFFRVMDIPAAQLVLQQLYFDIVIYATLIGVFRHVFSCFFSGIGRTKIVMFSAMTAMVVNIFANYVLIFGKLGFPALGIRGAAYGTIAGSLAGFLVVMLAYTSRKIRQEFKLAGSLAFDRMVMGKMLLYGYPGGMEFFLNLVSFTGMVMIFHSRGLVTAAAITILFNWDLVSFLPLVGIEVAVTSLVGRYMGARKPGTAHRSVMSGVKLAWGYSLVVFFFFVCFPAMLVDAFSPSEYSEIFSQARPTAIFMLRMASLYIMVDGILLVLAGALRGAGDTLWAMIVTVGFNFTILLASYAMLIANDFSAEATWTVVVIVFSLSCILFVLRYRGGKWRSIQVLAPRPVKRRPAAMSQK